MEQIQIRKNVEHEIEKWKNLLSRRNQYAKLTPKAIDFIVEVIENIQEDPRAAWKEKEIITLNSQSYAISLIPNALNDIINKSQYKYSKRPEIYISTWDIWFSLSDTLKNWCFIPRDI